MSDFSKILLSASGLALASVAFFPLAACKAPPSPPARAPGTSVSLDYASFSWKTEREFKRISEYFTEEENTGGNVVVRSDPEVRTGLYLIVGIRFPGKIPAGSTAELRYFSPSKKGEQTQEWTLPEFTGRPTAEIRLGLTGEKWSNADSRKRPTAWKLTITAPSGEKLVERKSFLWELPPENADAEK